MQTKGPGFRVIWWRLRGKLGLIAKAGGASMGVPYVALTCMCVCPLQSPGRALWGEEYVVTGAVRRIGMFFRRFQAQS